MSERAETEWQPLRFRDLDSFGHVYHAEYLTLLDEARTRFFRHAMELSDPTSYVLVHAEIDWESPLTRDDAAVRADFVLERIGTTSLTLGEVMYAPDGRTVSRGRTVVVLRDASTGASRPLTDTERGRAESLLVRTSNPSAKRLGDV
jgi:acyl-CoA thioester hydrolase